MKDRKTIAVVISHVISDLYSEYLEGIAVQAKSLGYDVGVFSLFTMNPDLTDFQSGEENIYNLINFDKVSGIIYDDNSFWPYPMKDRLVEMLHKKAEGKVVCINSNDPKGFENVLQPEVADFSKIVDHMIEVHGCKRIMCLTGFKDNRNAEERAEGYVRSMKAHGLEVHEGDIVYGDFWKNSAGPLAEDIASGRIEKPDAIVCANDCMAICLCEELYNRGFVVPDDIAVTGYDASIEAYENYPSITSIISSNQNIGARSVCKLHEMITGEKVEPCIEQSTRFAKGESCGCGKELGYMLKYSRTVSNDRFVGETYHASLMVEELTASNSIEECYKIIMSYVKLLDRDIKELTICMNEDWDSFSEDDDEFVSEGYAENMCMGMFYTPEKEELTDEKFRSADMFPPRMLEEKPVCCYFSPLHFGTRCFGYIAVKYASDAECAGRIFHLWVKNINTALEYLRVKERLSVINKRIYISSLRDGLTGIYNRQGYQVFSGEIFAKAKKEKKRLLLVVVDLDRLKYINDNFGHSDGDNAITMVAQAIQSCDGNGEKCFRTGGDEYAVLGCSDYTDEMADYCRQRINGYLGRYNDTSDKEYMVEASIGIFFDYVDGYSSIDECYAIADKLMYENKLARRKNRTD